MSLLISSSCDVAGCDGSVHFELPGARVRGRLTGPCDACGAWYDLYGGRKERFSGAGVGAAWATPAGSTAHAIDLDRRTRRGASRAEREVTVGSDEPGGRSHPVRPGR